MAAVDAAVEELPIGQVAHQTGHTVVRLRHWERVGLLDPPARRGGKRRYTPAVLERIAVIDLARRAGLSLAEIHQLLASAERHHARPTGARWRELVGHKQAELDELLAAVRAMQALLGRLAACDCVSLEECGARAVAETPDDRAGRCPSRPLPQLLYPNGAGPG